jgi:hypothetical protein
MKYIQKPPIVKTMQNHDLVLHIRQMCAIVAAIKRSKKITAAAVEGTYFHR